jgi:hypothetical protein
MHARHGVKCVGLAPGSVGAQLSSLRSNARAWRPVSPVAAGMLSALPSAGDKLAGTRATGARAPVVGPSLRTTTRTTVGRAAEKPAIPFGRRPP